MTLETLSEAVVNAGLEIYRGYAEFGASAREIVNPADESDVLDVWYELTFAKPIVDIESVIVEVRWALSVPKCIDP